jgi:hypothetical protein
MAFDVRAALAEIRANAALQTETPLAATLATPATNAGPRPPSLAEVADVAAPYPQTQKPAPLAAPENDATTMAAALRLHGPMTQGVAAAVLGWGATRTWQAEATLRPRARCIWTVGGGLNWCRTCKLTVIL